MLKIKKMLRAEKGFTLIELLIVVAIIAILATMALSGFAGTTGDAQGKVDQGSTAVVQSAADRFYFDHGKWPTANGDHGVIIRGLLDGTEIPNNTLTGDMEDFNASRIYIRNWPESNGSPMSFTIDENGKVK